jgi:shikimate kinase
MGETIILITGKSGAGKTTLGQRLATELQLPVFDIGNFQRAYAKSQGYSDVTRFNREVGLQKAYFDLLPSMLNEIKQIVHNGNGLVFVGFKNII